MSCIAVNRLDCLEEEARHVAKLEKEANELKRRNRKDVFKLLSGEDKLPRADVQRLLQIIRITERMK